MEVITPAEMVQDLQITPPQPAAPETVIIVEALVPEDIKPPGKGKRKTPAATTGKEPPPRRSTNLDKARQSARNRVSQISGKCKTTAWRSTSPRWAPGCHIR